VDVLVTDRPRRAVELRGEPHRTLPAGHLSH
jgi:glycerophosphoryl diester phosphodiesterase